MACRFRKQEFHEHSCDDLIYVLMQYNFDHIHDFKQKFHANIHIFDSVL